jgi:c-di-GMP-binding flagellar brake protein YcgR
MSSATTPESMAWCSGDDILLSVPETAEPWPTVVVRASKDRLHLRLSEDWARRRPIDAGTQVTLQRATQEGLMTASTELAQPFEGQGPHVVVRRPASPSLVQRRGNFRMPTALPLTVQVQQAKRNDWVSKRVYHHLTADASGSGCSIETEIPVEPGDRLRVTLWPDRPHATVAGARVVWTGPSDWPGLRRAGLVFTTISTSGQDRLVGTLLEEERVRRRVFADF